MERNILRREVGTRQMTMVGLLGNKDAVEATLKYVAATGRLKEKAEEEGGRRIQDGRTEQDRDMRGEGQGGNARNT